MFIPIDQDGISVFVGNTDHCRKKFTRLLMYSMFLLARLTICLAALLWLKSYFQVKAKNKT